MSEFESASQTALYSNIAWCESCISLRAYVERVEIVSESLLLILDHVHLSILNEIVNTEGTVDWDLVKIGTQSMQLSVLIEEKTTLEQSVVWGLDSWNQVCWTKCDLLNFSKIVLWVGIQDDSADFYKWVIVMAPRFCDIIYVPFILLSFCFRNQLNVPGPGRVVTLLNSFVQILAWEVRVEPSSCLSLIHCKVFDPLISLVGVLNEEDLTIFIRPLESIGTVAMHVSVTLWCASVGVHYGESMHRFRNLTEKVPHWVWVKEVLSRVLLKGMEEIGGHHWVSNEEYWEVYSKHIIVALISIEL